MTSANGCTVYRFLGGWGNLGGCLSSFDTLSSLLVPQSIYDTTARCLEASIGEFGHGTEVLDLARRLSCSTKCYGEDD